MTAVSVPVDELLVHVRVLARGSRSEIQGVRDGRLLIKTTSPPVGGAANRDVIRQLSEAFDVPPFRVLEPRRMPPYAVDLLPQNEA